MAFGFGASKSDSNNQAQYGQNVWGPQGNALQNMYGQQSGLFDWSNQGMQNMAPGASQNMQGIFDQSMNPWQNQMQGGAYAGMDLQGMYAQDRQGGGNEQFMNESIMGGAGNNYVDAMRGQMQQYSDQRLGSYLAMNDLRASGYGQSGSSRHGYTEGKLHDQSEQNLGRMQTQLGYESFDKDMDRKMNIARNADQFDMQRMQQSGNMLGQQNAAMQGGLNYGQNMQNLGMGGMAPYMAPWQAAGQYAQNMGRPTVLGSGSSSGSSGSAGFGFGI